MANICSVPKSGALPIYIRTSVPIYFLYNCLLLYFAPFLFGKCFEIKISFRQRGKAHFQIFTLPQQQWKENATVCSGPRWFSLLFQRWRHQFKNVQLIRSRCREHGAGNVSASPVSFPAARFPLISRQAGKVIVFAGCSLFWGDTPTRRIPPPSRPQHTKFALCRMRLRIYFRLDCGRSFWPKCQHIYAKWPAKNCLRQQLETNCLLTFLSLPSMRMIFHPLCCHRILSWLGNCSRRTALKHTTLPGMCGKMLKCNCYCGCGPMCDVVHL